MMFLGNGRLALVVLVGLLLAGLAARSEAQDAAAPAEKLVAGQVVDEEGNPVAGAKLSLKVTQEDQTSYDATLSSDAEGRFSYPLTEGQPRWVMIRAELLSPPRLAQQYFTSDPERDGYRRISSD